jgi:hypothetical protein
MTPKERYALGNCSCIALPPASMQSSVPYTGVHGACGKEVKIQLAIFTGTGISPDLLISLPVLPGIGGESCSYTVTSRVLQGRFQLLFFD